MSSLLTCQNLGKHFGSHVLFKDLTFGIHQGERLGLIGPNGIGKSSLLKILAGLEEADEGEVISRKNLRVAYASQMPEFPDDSLVEVLVKSQNLGHLHEEEKDTRAQVMLGKLGFENPEASANTLSGGQQKRLDLGRQLLQEPDLLFLDEPTNHLDLEGILWLEGFLLRSSTPFVVISHDRAFLGKVCNRVLELSSQFPGGLFTADGSYADFLEKRQGFLEGQAQYQKALSSKVRREVEWLRQTPQARTTKSQSRIQEAHRLQKELSEVKARNTQKTSEVDFVGSERQTRRLLVANRLCKSMGNRQLFSQVSFTLGPGVRLGIVGSNGTGKTTLLRILLGELQADQGTLKLADNLKIVYFDQQREQISLDTTLRRALAPSSDTVHYRGNQLHVNSWAQKFLFNPDRLDAPIRHLSGGERARILIARLMLKPADILLLDEPTNDLDIPTLEVLEDSLRDFPGAIVFISHDRFFMDEVSTCLLGLGHPGEAPLLADYGQWEAFQKEQQKDDSQPPAKKERKEGSKNEAKTERKRPKRRSYLEQREYEKIEELILEAETRVEKLQGKIENPAISANAAKLQSCCEDLHEAEERVAALYQRWEELEEKGG